MSYGLQITGTDGSTVFSVLDTDENPTNYVVAATGNGSTVNVANEVGSGGEARVFFKVPSTYPITASISNGVYNFKQYTISDDGGNPPNVTNATVSNYSVDWIILKDSPNVSVNTNINDYGLQVFKSDGTSISFDSTRLQTNESFRVLGVESIRSTAGDYLDADATIGSGYTGSRYVEATNLYYEDNGSSGECHGFAQVGSTTKFLRHSFFVWSYTGGGGRLDITRYYSNPFPIVYGELR
jgi:hypothetical protein